MSTARLIAASIVLSALRAHAQDFDDGEREALAARGPAPALTSAITERFADCYAAEGASLSASDRRVVEEALAPLARAIAGGIDAGDCASGAGESACIAAARGMSCEALAARLQSPNGPQPEPPSWAAGYARALTDRVTSCYLAELDAATVSGDESRALDGLRTSVARALAGSVINGRCVADENELPACALSIRATPCEQLASRLGDDGSPQAAVTDACARLVRCGEDGGADEATGSDPDVDF